MRLGLQVMAAAFVGSSDPGTARTLLASLARVRTPASLLTISTVRQPRTQMRAVRAIAAAAATGAASPGTKAAALSFFNGVRTPATLIAGSSIVALFSLASKARDTSGMEKSEILMLRLYHCLALLSFCLSMSTILTSTAASTKLLLSSQFQIAREIDVYHFLTDNMPFEFVFTRWSFLSSIILFVCCVTGRLVLEFNLLSQKRTLAGVTVMSTMMGVVSWMFSYVNQSLHCWPDLWTMTLQVVQMTWRRAFQGRQPMQVLSIIFFLVSFCCGLKFLYPPTVDRDRLVDAEGYL